MERDPTEAPAAFELGFAAGSEIFGVGQEATLFFVVRSGIVELTQRIHGRERRVGFAGPGDPIGEIALLPGRKHMVTARALEPVVALALTTASTLEMVAEQPEIGLKMLQKLTERLAEAHGQLATMLERESVVRVAQTLSAIADTQKNETLPNGVRMVRVRNEDLAAFARIDAASLLDVLAILGEKGMARRRDFGTLLVSSRVELEAFVDRMVGVRHRTRVLLVDDSVLFRRVLKTALETLPDISIVGTASDGHEALKAVRALRPDVIVMDVQMPVLNGIEATRSIMAEIPTPILILTSLADEDDGSLTFEALRAGAVALWPKPTEIPMPGKDVARLGDELRKLSEVDVGRVSAPTLIQPGQAEPGTGAAKRIAIVAEAGGPQALAWLFAHLPSDFAGQILLAQQLEAAHYKTLAEWLTAYGHLKCRLAVGGESFEPGVVLVSPPGFDLIVNPDGTVGLDKWVADVGPAPGNHLLESLALFEGPSSLGIILSGGGSDGAQGLRMLRDAGGLAFVQHPGDAVVDSMPRAALRTVPEARVFGLSELPSLMIQLTSGRPPQKPRAETTGS